MKDHIEKTIADCVGRIAKMQQLIRNLRTLDGESVVSERFAQSESPGLPDLILERGTATVRSNALNARTQLDAPKWCGVVGTANANEAARLRKYRAEKKAPEALGKTRKTQTVGLHDRVLELAARCVTPFNQSDILDLADGSLSLSQIRGALAYAAKTKRLVVMVQGKPGHPTIYRMRNGLANPPEPRPAPVAAPSAKTPEDRKSIKDELAVALKARDDARGRGNSKLEEIHQKRVDELDAALDAIGGD